MILDFEQIRSYFQDLLPGQKIGTRNRQAVKCPFHDDSSPSMTIFLDGCGGAHCNGCAVGGNIFQLESRRAGCSLAESEQRVAKITGARANSSNFGKLGPVVAAYDYRAADGQVLFQKRRYHPEGGGKTFRQYRPTETGGWAAGIDEAGVEPTKRVLYNLPLLVTANVALVCEGEKDADILTQAGLWRDRTTLRVASTTSYDGAWQPGEKSKWLPQYNEFFAGKLVLIFQDNDAAGRTFAEAVAAGVYTRAHQVKIVVLPGLLEKGDVTDWLETHSAKELEAEIANTPAWRPVAQTRMYGMFQGAVSFAAEAESTVDWLIEGVNPRAGNGFVGGHPKASKSFSSLDMAVAASCGVPWLGLRIPKPIKTAIVSREDEPGLTRRRLKKLIAGRPEYARLDDSSMLINTRQHQADFRVTRQDHLDDLIEQLGRFGAELVVLDVFRSIHDSEENDNTAVAEVLAKVGRIQTELQCACALVHHIGKTESANIFRGLRGASAIHGWMEWGIGISVTNPEEEDRSKYIRRAEFESKEAVTDAVLFQIAESPDHATVCLNRVDAVSFRSVRRASTASIVPLQTRERKDWA